MKLITSRIEVSIKFIITCWVCLAICLSLMIKIFYHTNFIEHPKPIESNELESVEISNLIYNVEPDMRLTDMNNFDKIDTNKEFKRSEVIFEDKGYTYGKRIEPVVDISIPEYDNMDMRNYTDKVNTDEYQYLGSYNITGYTPKCNHCCGNENGITASGVDAIAGYTVAAPKHIPFGTTLYIENYGYYVVEDRGNFPDTVIDIAAPNHDACYTLTNNNVSVYVVSSNISTTNELN